MAVGIAVADQVTKYLAEARLEPGRRVDVLGDLLGLRLYYNSGAAFSLGTGITPVITTFGCIAVVVMVVALTRTWRRSWALAIGVLLGGAVGNLMDRLLRPPGVGRGEVVDFFELPSFPIFNVADIAITTGALLIVLLSVRDVPFGPDSPDRGPDAGGSSAAGTPAATDTTAEPTRDA